MTTHTHRLEDFTADFTKEVKDFTDKLSAIKASADWLYQVQQRGDPQELDAIRNIITAVDNAIRKTDAFRKIAEALAAGFVAEDVFRELRNGRKD